MVIDALPSGGERILSFIHSVDVSLIQFAAFDEILAIFKHSLNFWLVLLYFTKKELQEKAK